MSGGGHQRSHRVRAQLPGIVIWLWLWLLQSIGGGHYCGDIQMHFLHLTELNTWLH